MNHEMPPHLEDEINNWYEGNLKRRLQKAYQSVDEIMQGKKKITDAELKETVIKANKVIEEVSNGDTELYDYYRYRVFIQDNNFIIIWGKEVCLDEGKDGV